ncbi:acyl-CoA dehydrogenase family protein [Thermopolyspora sp. NPDC052614]|uniref:acyl-CoA dehydrogenase family protein n=1 Tax=Thermopolyspora sp. NPDC052614 TaxID=3155682 RepID=UPI0034338F06
MSDQSTSHDKAAEVLRDHAEEADRNGRVAPESLEAVSASGGFALGTPAAFGGAGADAETVSRFLASLGRACPSTAWITGTCMVSKDLVATYLPESVQREFFADPDGLACGSGLPSCGRGEPVAGGIRVTGAWPNVSGCEDATWATLALMIDARPHLAAIPVADLTVRRTWHMAGMRGTASHSLAADGVLVPAERIADWSVPPLAKRLAYALTVLGPVVGAARGALDVIDELFASDRKPYMTTYSRMGESPGARHWLAEATHLVDRAERTMLAVARAADSPDLSDGDGVGLQRDLAGAGGDCRAAVELMLDLYGASGFDTASPLQRYWRDVAVGSRHPHLRNYLAAERLGSALADRRIGQQ